MATDSRDVKGTVAMSAVTQHFSFYRIKQAFKGKVLSHSEHGY